MMGIRSDEIESDEVKLPDGSEGVAQVVTVGEAIMDLAEYSPFDGADDKEIR